MFSSSPSPFLSASSRLSALFLALFCAAGFAAEPASSEAVKPTSPPHQPVIEEPLSDFGDTGYRVAVEQALQAFERVAGRALVPGEKKKVGIKIYADSGPGLATPFPLIRGVIAALEKRGYAKADIFLVGLNPLRLRLTGFLPSYATGLAPFQGHPMFVLESGKFYDPSWFYDSPLPARFDQVLNEQAVRTAAKGKNQTTTEEDRKSFLATPLFLEADFWINLPVYTDHPGLGVNGALVNATLWNASNTFRFFKSPATAPAAVAEMAAIPELREGWAMTIVSLQLYQFIGGPYFNSLYTSSEPKIWLSADPVLLDALMLDRMNRSRKRTGFDPIGEEETRMLEFAEQLGVGWRDTAKVEWLRSDGR